MPGIFKSQVDIGIVYDLLDQIATKLDKWYVIDATCFRLLKFHSDTLYANFVERLMPHYHLSKQFYLTRELTYNSFTTIIRQICNINGVVFERKNRYNQSMFSTDYFVQRVVPDADAALTSAPRQQKL
jgi:hypothetical protein